MHIHIINFLVFICVKDNQSCTTLVIYIKIYNCKTRKITNAYYFYNFHSILFISWHLNYNFGNYKHFNINPKMAHYIFLNFLYFIFTWMIFFFFFTLYIVIQCLKHRKNLIIFLSICYLTILQPSIRISNTYTMRARSKDIRWQMKNKQSLCMFI